MNTALIDIIVGISGTINILIAAVVFARGKFAFTRFFFFTLSLAMGVWSLIYIPYLNNLIFDQLFWIKAIYFFGCIAVVSTFYFSYAFSDNKLPPRSLAITYITFNLIFLVTLLFTNLILDSVVTTDNGPETRVGILYPLVFVGWIPFTVLAAWKLLRKYLSSSGVSREQLLYIFTGVAFLTTSIIVFDLIIPIVYGTTAFFPVSAASSIFFVSLTGYAIVRHQLLDIRLIVARSLAYAFLLLTLASMYGAAVFAVTNLLIPKSFNLTDGPYVYAALAVVLAFTFQPLKNVFTKASDRIFFKDAYDSEELLKKLSYSMSVNFELDPLLSSLLKDIVEIIRIGNGSFVLFRENKPYVAKTYGMGDQQNYDISSVSSLLNQKVLMIFDDLEEGEIKRILRELGTVVAVPLLAESNLIGFLFLGEKKSGEVYSEQDVKVIEILGSEIAVAVANAQAVDQIEQFNETLKKEVNDATAELKTKNDQISKALEELKSLDVMKDQLIAVTSHELKSPATIIQNYLWIILNQPDPGTKIVDSDKTKIERSLSSIQTLIRLINDILNASRIEGGRMAVSIEKVSPEETIKQVVTDYSEKASEKGLSITYLNKNPLKPILADKEKFTEVVTNLVTNAIKYTDAGSITIEVKEENGIETFVFSDTGRGIAPDNLTHLFEKFYRVDSSLTASNAKTGGTGLGLYITKSYIELMSGKIWVETKLGQGSKFYFSLPVATEVSENPILNSTK